MKTVSGLARTYNVYLPPNLDPTAPIPLVLVFHGYSMSGAEMAAITGYPALADTEGIAVAFPDGEGGPDSLAAPWNIGPNVCPNSTGITPDAGGDDLGFIDAMEHDIAADQCLDAAHIFVTGFSMGGYFTHHAGCMRPDIRGIAPHSGGTHDLSACASTHKPVIIFHGLADPVVPSGCDDPAATNTPMGFTPSATEWAAKNGCSMQTTTQMVQGGTCMTYTGCPADGQVELCTFPGMGHCWAGGVPNTGTSSCPPYESATKLEWAFWRKYAW